MILSIAKVSIILLFALTMTGKLSVNSNVSNLQVEPQQNPNTKSNKQILSVLASKEKDPMIQIELLSTYFNVSTEMALYLSHIESNTCLKPYNNYPNKPRTSARGCFSFIEDTWKEKCSGDVDNNYDNIYCAMKIISEEGLGRWTVDDNIKRKLKEADFI